MTRTARIALLTLVAALITPASFAAFADQDCIVTLASMYGETPGAYLGITVAGGGDFNGDGYQDVLVGAERYNTVGRAYLLFGGPGPHDEPDLVFGGGDLSGVRFGASLAWAGDVNGDGFDDILIGDPLRSIGQGRQGQVYLYLGGAHPDTTRDMRFFAQNPEQTQFGMSVAGADFNADGYSDVVIGEPGASSSVYVFFGGPAMDDQADLRIWRGGQSLGFGTTVASLGDFNGDGFDDIAIGWPTALNLGQSRVYVSYGGPSTAGALNLTFASAFPEDRMGFSLAGPGDVNGDGRADLIVGAPAVGAHGGGRVHLYLGGTPPSLTPVRTYEGLATTRLGSSVAGAGDIDGDTRPDYVIGAPGSGTLWDPPGSLRVVSYASGELCRIDGIPGELFGRSVGASPEFFGSGTPALFAGAPLHATTGTDAGRLWIGMAVLAPVPAQASLVRIDWVGDRVEMLWSTSGSIHSTWRIERHAAETGWVPGDVLLADGTGMLYFEDRDVVPGDRYGYRLKEGGVSGSVLAEAWIDIPAVEALHLSGFRPNPARGAPRIEFTLPVGGPVTIELLDPAGRRIGDAVAASLPAGRHFLPMSAAVPPGVYVIRMRHRGEERRALGVVTR